MIMKESGIRYDRIKALREEHGYTLRYVASHIGVTESVSILLTNLKRESTIKIWIFFKKYRIPY